jgi:hypothetical protein
LNWSKAASLPADKHIRLVLTAAATTACEVSMQRHEMMTAMAELGRKGMAGAFDEATTGLQRKRMTMEILPDLLRAETAHRHAASVRYRMSAAKLSAVKDLDAFVFDGTLINEGLVRSLHSGSFLQRWRKRSAFNAATKPHRPSCGPCL